MIAGLKTLNDLNVKGKTVFLRLDLNSDVRNGRVIFSERFTAPLKTIRELKRKGAKIVIAAHQGRKGSKDFISLKQHAAILGKYVKVKFVADVIGKRALKAIESLENGDIVMLDNLRFVNGEMNYTSGGNELVSALLPLLDIYINDAFSASHREHASIVGFTKLLDSAIGRTFEDELKNAQKLNIKNAALILGGIKPDDFVDLIDKTKGKILPTGYFAFLCFRFFGVKLGRQDKMIREFFPIVDVIRKNKQRFVFPIDITIDKNGKRIDLKKDDFPSNYPIYDIGEETVELYLREIKKAKTIFFKGLPGLCNNKDFSYGTEELLRGVASSKAFSVIGGGHTLTMIDKLKIPKKKFGYISLSGGALVHYLANDTLVGIDALKS